MLGYIARKLVQTMLNERTVPANSMLLGNPQFRPRSDYRLIVSEMTTSGR